MKKSRTRWSCIVNTMAMPCSASLRRQDINMQIIDFFRSIPVSALKWLMPICDVSSIDISAKGVKCLEKFCIHIIYSRCAPKLTHCGPVAWYGALSNYMNQCWSAINNVQWHLFEGNVSHPTKTWKIAKSKILFKSPWANELTHRVLRSHHPSGSTPWCSGWKHDVCGVQLGIE